MTLHRIDFVSTPTLAHPRPSARWNAWHRIALASGTALLGSALLLGVALSSGASDDEVAAADDLSVVSDEPANSHAPAADVSAALDAMHLPWLTLLDTLEARLADTSGGTSGDTLSISALDVRGPERQLKLTLLAADSATALKFGERLRLIPALSGLRPTQQDTALQQGSTRLSMTLEGPWQPFPPLGSQTLEAALATAPEARP